MVWRLKSFSSSSLMRAQTPSPNSVPLGTTTAARAGRPGRCRLAVQLAHDELQEQQRGLGGLPVLREVALDALLLLAAKGRVGEDHIHPVLLADLGELEAQGVAGVDVRRIEAVQQQVHLAEQIGQGLRLAPEQRPLLQAPCGRPRSSPAWLRWLNASTRNPPVPAGRVEHGLAQPRVGDLDHEPHHRARGVELAGIARGIAHLAQHGFVQRPQSVQLVAGGEVDAGDLVDHVAQQVAATSSGCPRP